MSKLIQPTAFPDINAVLWHFLVHIRELLGIHFRGMYLYGSLALGDFDPRTSDIDFLVMTDADIGDDLFAGLRDMHERFNASDSAWAGKVEAAYISEGALRCALPSSARYPQIEKGGTLARDALEAGWVFQCASLRERGIVLAGPDPRTLIATVDREEMRRAAEAIAGMWLDQARHDSDWLAWVRPRNHQAFVVLTLCRLLYSLDTGSVASKPAAARWAQDALDESWTTLIADALVGQHENDEAEATENDVRETIALIGFAYRRIIGPR